MTIYYLKEDDYLYRFSSYADLENLTGKSRRLMKHNLASAIVEFFPNGQLCGRHGALIKGWTDLNGNPTASLKKGNSYTGLRSVEPLDRLVDKLKLDKESAR